MKKLKSYTPKRNLHLAEMPACVTDSCSTDTVVVYFENDVCRLYTAFQP
jgi:hypothetical protein